ncbi:MAG: sigma-70 family RNA polymerase sigma factor, partial [Planctomycetota bacterium]
RDALVMYIEASKPQLLTFIRRSMSDAMRRKVEPEDILQEVGVAALQSLADVQLADRDPFRWLCQLSERRIIDAHRRYFAAQKRSAEKERDLYSGGDASGQRGFIDVLAASITSPSQAFSRDQREFRLLAALEQLPVEHQSAIRLRYVEGLPSKEIAEQLGKSDGAVRVMLTRSLSKLQEMLDD